MVAKLLVAVGDMVAQDQPLLILEAMKMQNEIRAEREGVVQEVFVAPGTAVPAGAALVRLGVNGAG